MKKLILLLCIFLGGYSATGSAQQSGFKFAFLTDIHLSLENHAGFAGFRQAIEHAKSNGAAFIITGGDNVDIDILGNKINEAVLLYKKYKEELDKAGIKIYPAIGNHDRYMGDDKNSHLYNDGMYKKHLAKPYYAFDYQNWHFIILNSTQTCQGKYCVDEEQIKWLEDDLYNTATSTPIVVITHVPFLSVYYPVIEGKYKPDDTFVNFKEVWDLFKNHNLKLVLQGHMHLYEEIKVKNVQFITAGAVSASWWGGAYHGTEEGYLLVRLNDEDLSWEYVDYGWEGKSKIYYPGKY